MTQLITFSFNGQFYSVKQKITLFELITYFNFKNSLSVIEYNSLISNKNNWKQITIENQDQIEIVTIVGGG